MEKFGSAVILAGGQSRRMGFDKQTLEHNGERLIHGLTEKLSVLFDEIIISTNTPELYEEFKDGRIVLLRDEAGAGPLAGLFGALKYCKSEYLFATACDMPFLSLPFIEYMMKSLRENPKYKACVTSRGDGFYEAFNCFYSKDILELISHSIEIGDYGVNGLLNRINSAEEKLLVIGRDLAAAIAGENIFFNINSKEDLEIWKSL